MATGPPLTLADLDRIPVTRLKGVGEKKAGALSHLGIESVLDILTHYPRRYIDRTREATIAELAVGEEGMVLGRVLRVDSRRTRNRRSLVNVEMTDDTGRLTLTFFNQPWRERQLRQDMQVVVFGRMESYRGRNQMTNPVVDLVGDRTGRIVPVYPQSEKAGLQTWEIAAWVADALDRARPRGFAEPLPESIRHRYELVDRARAFAGIHTPETMQEVSLARRRLVFDELLRIQLVLVLRKRAVEESTRGVVHSAEGSLLGRLVAGLPFVLTAAQSRVIEEVVADMVAAAPMHRLLQGDVGSGKTIVALAALLTAVEGGHQGALMAPTEVLAEQHHASLRAMLEGFEVEDPTNLLGRRELRVALLTNRTPAAVRRRVLEELGRGEVDIAVGTHALIQEAVGFDTLGVVVIDEQHRFGVDQRAALRDKGDGSAVPDVLVMTATPIPRTAAMTVYGDLDVSVLDELPPGRTPIVTRWIRSTPEAGDTDEPLAGGAGRAAEEEAERVVWEAVRAQVAEGRQAYVVCPLIEESDKLEVASAEQTWERLSAEELSGLSVGLLHGRLGPTEKDEVMALFRSGRTDVLVATTVIEVGVDVPNATIMVILGADRFGVAQLHQLRGRVGRGAEQSWCYLVGQGATPEAQARLEAMVRTTDGFELAEVDLELRGEGTIMGSVQKGRNDLKLASLRRDKEWVARARDVALALVDESPSLSRFPALADEMDLTIGDDEADYLLKS